MYPERGEYKKACRTFGGEEMTDYRNILCITCDNGTPATMIAHVPEGCHVVKNQYQPLCEQHWITLESTGPMTVVEEIGK